MNESDGIEEMDKINGKKNRLKRGTVLRETLEIIISSVSDKVLDEHDVALYRLPDKMNLKCLHGIEHFTTYIHFSYSSW